jgi:hypothetical protein
VEADRRSPARRYERRPGRIVVVTSTLDELQGPVSGVIELPNRLLWRPNRTVDLNDAWSLGWMYALVLREAHGREDLREWINGEVLMRLWPELNLPRGVRQAWEDVHPELRTMRAAA